MTPDASRLPSAEEWAQLLTETSKAWLDGDGGPISRREYWAQAIAAKVRALVRANLKRYGPSSHAADCQMVTLEVPVGTWAACTCGLAALLADEEAPRG